MTYYYYLRKKIEVENISPKFSNEIYSETYKLIYNYSKYYDLYKYMKKRLFSNENIKEKYIEEKIVDYILSNNVIIDYELQKDFRVTPKIKK